MILSKRFLQVDKHLIFEVNNQTRYLSSASKYVDSSAVKGEHLAEVRGKSFITSTRYTVSIFVNHLCQYISENLFLYCDIRKLF